ncbi:glycosyltransferase family 4 protein [Halosolutus halophilus]|uniref:glycosyltransferase family 4 protein n=1 Tax=Halosolutus halophilus TaxID=1552990 RepID=UPI0022351603|nr:glycosyltransferase family 4 protein [Halosolutus halophilus]
MSAKSIVLVVIVDELDENNAVYSAVQNFIDVYEDEVDRIAIIGPSSIDIDRRIVDPVPVKWPSASHTLFSALNFVRYQIRIAKNLRQEKEQSELVFFHIGGTLLLLPMVTNRLSKFRSLVFITGSTEKGIYARHGQGLLSKIAAKSIKTVESCTCLLADRVILLSESMKPPSISWPISSNKIVANFNFINTKVFKKQTPIEDRTADIIFVGRLEHVKGVENIVHALPGLVDQHPNLQVMFIGSGEQQDELEDFVKRHGLNNHVTFTGWVDRENLPEYMDNAQTLLMPSLSEGVPKTLLEAMSCGTIPIASRVGGIPDIVDDEKNGFLLQNTNPETIKRTVSSVLNRDDLETISNNASQYIERHHSYTSVREQYREILNVEDSNGTKS